MAKSLLLLGISLFATIACGPAMLSSADEVAMTGLNPAGMVETVPLPEPEPEYEVLSTIIYTEPVVQNYTVTQYVGSRAEFNATAGSLSYGDLYKYGKMIYGHNSAGLLGSLAYRYVGEKITVTEGGAPANYVVSDIALYAKTPDGRLEGNPGLMSSIANTAMGHDLALFTCAGTLYGNGDASHRLVVYVDRV